MNRVHCKSIAVVLLGIVSAAGSSIPVIASAANDTPRRFTVPGSVAISLVEEFRKANGIHAALSGKKVGSNAAYCPGSIAFVGTRCRFSFLSLINNSEPDCAQVAKGWKVLDVRINGTPKEWTSRTWKKNKRCLTAEIFVGHQSTNQRNFSLHSVVLEGPANATSFRAAFDY